MRAKMFAPLLYQINAMSSSGFYFLYAVFYSKLVSAAFLQSFDKQNTKNGRRCAKPSHFLPLKMGTTLSPQAKAVQHPTGSRFLK